MGALPHALGEERHFALIGWNQVDRFGVADNPLATILTSWRAPFGLAKAEAIYPKRTRYLERSAYEELLIAGATLSVSGLVPDTEE